MTLPTGSTSHSIAASNLGSGATAVADVWFTNPYTAYTAAEQTAIRTFVQQGGGLVLGGQGWSWTQKGYTIDTYPGNVLLAPLNLLQWTDALGEW